MSEAVAGFPDDDTLGASSKSQSIENSGPKLAESTVDEVEEEDERDIKIRALEESLQNEKALRQKDIEQLQLIISDLTRRLHNAQHTVDAQKRIASNATRASSRFRDKENGGERYNVKQQYKIAKGRHIASEKSLVPDHCSALVKILPDYSDVLFGHVTWDDYQCAAPRIFKSFEYPYLKNNEPVGWYVTHFSSSPGMLSSVDDFYINRGATYSAVMETSLDIYENDLLDKLQPLSVLAWMRTITANFLATGGDDWVKVFSTHASGTYSNQWMILDLNKFSAGQKPQAGFLTVLEEMPGYIHWEDMTDYITKSSYWPSYNNPYFQDIADISGQTDLCASDDMFCYDTDPRGQIFAAHQANIQTAEDFEKMLGYNHYETDPISQNNSCHAISCRMDLQPNVTLRYPFGAIDAKMSSYSLALPATADAITDYDHEYYGALSIPVVKSRFGMTHDTQEPFCWDKFKDKTDIRGKPFNHYGHPECFDYDWITLPPKINDKFR